MAEPMKDLNRQQQVKTEDDPERKPAENELVVDEADKTTSITDVCYDCLERIFNHLDLESLLMVARTCNRLQVEAAEKFASQYGRKLISLCPYSDIKDVCVYDDKVIVFGLEFCLSFLRCFGAKISNLTVGYNRLDGEIDHLGEYINEYCADALTSVSFNYKQKFSSHAFQKPFEHVETLEIAQCHLVETCLDGFPNLRRLDIVDCSVVPSTPMNVSFPHLRHLCIGISNYTIYDTNRLLMKKAVNILQANRQVQSVKIQSGVVSTFTALLDAIGQNTSVSKLHVDFDSTTTVYSDSLNRFAAEHPLVVKLVLLHVLLAAGDVIDFIRQMKSLKRIKFEIRNNTEYNRVLKLLDHEWRSRISRVTDDNNHTSCYVELMRRKIH